MTVEQAFKAWFKHATRYEGCEGHEPYPYQIRFATVSTVPQLVDVPTGSPA